MGIVLDFFFESIQVLPGKRLKNERSSSWGPSAARSPLYFTLWGLPADLHLFFLLGLDQICYDTWIISSTVTRFWTLLTNKLWEFGFLFEKLHLILWKMSKNTGPGNLFFPMISKKFLNFQTDLNSFVFILITKSNQSDESLSVPLGVTCN